MSADELALVNKVELRIALAGDSAKFENSLNLYLAPLILKLSSPHAEVRKVVSKCLQNIIPRISAFRDIKLPVGTLLKQVDDPKIPQGADSSSVRLYSLLFVSKGIDRLSESERFSLIPLALKGISFRTRPVAARLFSCFHRLLENWKCPDKDSVEGLEIMHSMSEEDKMFVLELIWKFFLLQPTSSQNLSACPGLSQSDVSFFTRDAAIVFDNIQSLRAVKQRLLEFLKLGFDDSQLAIPFLVASTDSSSVINNPAEFALKRLHYDVDDLQFVNKCTELFTGSNETLPASSVLQERILSILSRSKSALENPKSLDLAKAGLKSENSKLKTTCMNYIKAFAMNDNSKTDGRNRHASGQFNKDIAAQLRDMITVLEGSEETLTSQAKNERSLMFESLGTILRTCPSLLIEDLSYLEVFFKSLYDGSESRTIIQDALSGLTSCLGSLSSSQQAVLKQICRKYIDVDPLNHNVGSASCQYIALKFINYAFPFNDSEARLLCVLGSAELNRPEAIEEANKGLHPYWFNLSRTITGEEENLSSLQFPGFEEYMILIGKEWDKGRYLGYSLGRGLEFAFHILVMQSIKSQKSSFVIDESWKAKLDKAIEYEIPIKQMLTNEIKRIAISDDDEEAEVDSSNSYYMLIQMSMEAMVSQYSHNGSRYSRSSSYRYILSHLIPLTPQSVIMRCNQYVKVIIDLMDTKQLHHTSVDQMAQILGILGSNPTFTDNDVNEIIEILMKDTKINNYKEGNMLSLSYLFSRLVLRDRVELATSEKFERYLKCLISKLDSNTSSDYIMDSLFNLSIFGALGPRLNSSLNEFKSSIAKAVINRAKKYDEKALLALSALQMCGYYPSEYSLDDYIQLIYESHNSKQVENAFTGGEAFSILAFGWRSKFLEPYIDILGTEIKYIPEENACAERVIDLVLESCSSTKPSLRKFSCIWLLTLVQYCGHLKVIQDKAQVIHLSFMKFLADRDELVQESASKGLGLVYEIGDNDLKETLVKSLLKSFTDSKASNALSAGTIGLETELFEADVLKTDDGTISTYKDVLNLASEVGDPSLVYKFMSLAKSSAIWTSRKGLAFGLGSILSSTSLDSMLESDEKLNQKLIPKLFRYRYDPNSSVASSMNDIWNVLVKDSAKTIKANCSLILEELLLGMGNREWRIRQASTSALGDLLQFIPKQLYDSKSQDIWNMSFRVMDDVKGSVRKEGNNLTTSLASKLVNRLEKEGESESSSSFLKSLIPFLMGNKGLLSDSEEVKTFALKTILDLCRVGRKAVKPYVPDLIEQLITLMSTLEPEIVNYLALNADKYNIESNDLDAKRLQSLTSSPLMDAIDKLLDQLDESMMQSFIFKLRSTVKSSVGLPSKVCGSRVIVSLITSYVNLVKPYGDILLKACISQINDKNPTVASTYAAATGYCCRISNVAAVVEFSKTLNNLYFEGDDESERFLTATACESICKYSGERFETVSAAFLPLAFIGKHDIHKATRVVFERVWVDNTGGNSSSIKLFYTEVVKFFEKYIDTRRYDIRQILANSILDLSKSVDLLSDDKVSHLIDLLVDSLKGRSWDGKELVLESLITVCIKFKDFWSNKEEYNNISEIVITNAKKKNREYQKHSIKLLGNFMAHFPSESILSTYMSVMDTFISNDVVEDDSDADEMEVDSDTRMSKVKNVALEENSLEFLTNILQSFPLLDSTYVELYLEYCVKKIGTVLTSNKFDATWRSHLKCSELMAALFTKFTNSKITVSGTSMNEVSQIWNKIYDLSFSHGSIENVKIQFIRMTKLLINYTQLIGISSEQYLSCLQVIKEKETSSIIQKELIIG